jgi:hypothetical protein
MVLSFSKLLLLVVAGQLSLATGFVFPSTTKAPTAFSSPITFFPPGIVIDNDKLTGRHTHVPEIAVEGTGTRRSLPKLHLHVEDSELGDVVDIILEMRELLVPEPSVLASMTKILEMSLQMSN